MQRSTPFLIGLGAGSHENMYSSASSLKLSLPVLLRRLRSSTNSDRVETENLPTPRAKLPDPFSIHMTGEI